MVKYNKTSISICKSGIQQLKNLTNSKTFSRYQNYISNISEEFINNKQTLLETIFNIKNNTNFDLFINNISLDNNNRIPPFSEIFKYLATQNDFLNNFTSPEQNIITKISTKDSKTIYNFLKSDDLSKKIIDKYYYLPINIKTYLETEYPSIKFHELLINSFTSFEIIEDLENNIKQLITFDIIFKEKEYKNFIYFFTYNTNKINKDDITNLGRDIVSRILFFNQFLNTNKTPNRFIIFFTDNKKEIDTNIIDNLHFKTINVNTAVTNSKDIIIYRQQELLKSIFHEMIHFYNLDFRTIPEYVIQYLFKTHNISNKNEYIIFESITETLANILNNIYLSPDINTFKTNLENEIFFSTLQLGKILSICNYNQWKEFSNVEKYGIQIDKQFKQESCVFSYYVLKLYILLNLDKYFNIIAKNKLKFIENTTNYNELIEIYDMGRQNIYLETIINEILKKNKKYKLSKKISKNIKNIKSKKNRTSRNNITKFNNINSNINKTLRMTCTESGLKIINKNSI
jgi:hypothetical protein